MKIKNEYLGLNGFVWWIGIVEDNNDPLRSGRVKVRCLEWHTKDKSILPTEDLPWAQIMMPANNASNSGIGHSPNGIINGSWVIGFFLDGHDAQRPLVMGSIPGIPSDEPNPNIGFNDPDGVYPNKVNEPDTNRLARNDQDGLEGYESFQHEVIQKKEDDREQNIRIANAQQTYNQPASKYFPFYPHNQVFETTGGHIKEYDSTPGSERIHEYHKSGSFYEIDATGNKVTKVKGRNYSITANSEFVYIKGSCFLTIDQNCYTHIGGNWDIYVKGYKREVVDGEVVEKYNANQFTTVGNFLDIEASRIDFNKSQSAGGGGGFFGSFFGRVLSGVVSSVVLPAVSSTIMESLGNVVGDISSSLGLDSVLDSFDLGVVTDNFQVDEFGRQFTENTLTGEKIFQSGNIVSDVMKSTRSNPIGASLKTLATRTFRGDIPLNNILAPVIDFGKQNVIQAAGDWVTQGINPDGGTLGQIGGDLVKGVLTGDNNFDINNISIPNFSVGLISEGGSLIDRAKTETLKLGGNLTREMLSIDDFVENIKTSRDVVEAFGEKGADLLGTSVDAILNPALLTNGFVEDITRGRTIPQIQQKILEEGIAMGGAALEDSVLGSIPHFLNAQKLFKGATDLAFNGKDILEKIDLSLNVNDIATNLLSENQQVKDVFDAAYVTDQGRKDILTKLITDKIDTSLVQNQDVLVNVSSLDLTKIQERLNTPNSSETGIDSNGNSIYTSALQDAIAPKTNTANDPNKTV